METGHYATPIRSRFAAASRRGLLAILSLSFGGESAAAKKKKRKRKKKKKSEQCPPNCLDRTCGNDGCGGSCGSCAAFQTCSGGVCASLACGAGGPCRVFVTSTAHTGDLNGLAGADFICKNRAAAAGLQGTYMAWLTDEFLAPAYRFTQSSGPYQLVTGITVANTWGDLTDGMLTAAIQVNELGAAAGAPFEVWSNTKANGTPDEFGTLAHCDNWTDATTSPPQGRYGLTPATNSNFTSAGFGDCNIARRLYCFQQS